MSERIPKHKALRLLERAQVHLAHREFPQAEALLRDLLHSELKGSAVPGLLGDALVGQGRDDEAFSLWREALEESPKDPELHARIGAALSRRGRPEEALPHLERAGAEHRKDPGTLIHLAFAYLSAGRAAEAERAAARAVGFGGGADAKLVLAAIRGRQGRYEDAERLCREVEASSPSAEVIDSAQGLRADALLLSGDAKAALELWRALRARGSMDPAHLAHLAYAAQVCGDAALADELIAQRTKEGAGGAEDLLLFAQIANLRARPDEALTLIAQAEGAAGARHPGWAFEVHATRGRALRLQGRREEARSALGALANAPESRNARLGPKVHVDLGHLAAEEGDFETAEQHFHTALELDSADPEAQHALALTQRRVAWRQEVEASAQARVEAARAEAEALRRRFSAREGELEKLRAELAQAKAAAAVATQQTRADPAEQQRALREELVAREVDSDEKARANVETALGDALARCPKPVLDAFLVAEKTFQKALYTELPAAAVAVLYAGALERALYTFFVDRFRTWLREQRRLADFLDGAVRERRGTRVEYFDHFVEAFDEVRPGRAPSMGEVGRVLARRNELYLREFNAYLKTTFGDDPPFFDALAEFVVWTKETLRDPVAHGRGDAVGYDQLRAFRERLFGAFLARLIPAVR